ncbi:Endonuclease/exonuclease/phosphatase [Sesbania bispinosa]|nr:Endonuclease/exonuclease/phosphatase [Sesbania bispinosa]
MSSIDRRTPKYSAKLGVPPAKSILSLAQEQRFWNHKTTQHNQGSSGDQKGELRKMNTDTGQSVQGGDTQAPQAATTSQQSVSARKKATTSNILTQQRKDKGVVETVTSNPQSFVSEHRRMPPQPMQTNSTKEIGPTMPVSRGPHTHADVEAIRKANPKENRYKGANLSLEEVGKCRGVMLKPSTQQESIHDLGYFVEFLEEEDDDNNRKAQVQLKQEEESQLIVGWNSSLSFKRYREDAFIDVGDCFDDLWHQFKKTKTWEGPTDQKTKKAKLREWFKWKCIKSGEASHDLPPPPAMSWLSWNCRGLSVSSTISELKELCSKYKPSLVFLSETRATGNKVEAVKRQLRFQHCFWIDLIGLSGGLCILWSRSLKVSISYHNNNFIQTFIEDVVEVKSWQATFIYGNPTFQQRRNLWDNIQAHRTNSARPWIILGDFNELLYHHEKEGLHPQQQVRMNLFRQFVSNSGLMDVELKGCGFTWYSNPRNDFVTREKLDRVLVNWEWRCIFPHAMAMAIPSTSFDHTPIILWPTPLLRSGRYFNFEAYWEDHEECNSVVQNGWTDGSQDS